jgi:hypothetical protein
MYCDVCEERGVKDHGFQFFEMELVDTVEHTPERSTHTYEGECPKCGTTFQYISYREEVHHTFCKKSE